MSHGRNLLMKRPSSAFSFGNALSFAGADQNVSIPNGALTNTFTLSAWFNFSEVAPSNRTIWGFSTAALYLHIRNTTTFRFALGTTFDFTVPTMVNNSWYHLFYTSNAGLYRLYLNGVISVTQPSTPDSNIEKITRMGTAGDGFQRDFIGLLNEGCIWEGVVGTQQNAIDLYNGGDGVDAASIIPSPKTYYRYDESGTDSVAVDSSGNGNDGTLNNFSFSPSPWVAH